MHSGRVFLVERSRLDRRERLVRCWPVLRGCCAVVGVTGNETGGAVGFEHEPKGKLCVRGLGGKVGSGSGNGQSPVGLS